VRNIGQTQRLLSNEETGLLRFLGFVVLAVTGFICCWVIVITAGTNRDHRDLVVLCIISSFITWLLTSLASISAGPYGIEARTLWRTRPISYTRITRVSSLPFLRMFCGALLLITITYRTRDGARRRVRFVGKHERCIRGVHPAVSFLLEKAGIR